MVAKNKGRGKYYNLKSFKAFLSFFPPNLPSRTPPVNPPATPGDCQQVF